MINIDEIKKKLEKHERRISDLENRLNSKSKPLSLNDETVISNLIDSGFFDKHKKYSEIIKQLKIQAQFNKKINYMGILKKLTREGKLERKMIKHQWMYIKNV